MASSVIPEPSARTGGAGPPTAFTAPLARHVNVERFQVLPERVVILTVETLPAPHFLVAERLTILPRERTVTIGSPIDV